MKKLALMVVAAALAACVQTGETQLARNVWQVETNARGIIGVSMADKQFTRRVAELTIAQGYTHYIIQDPTTQNGSEFAGFTPGSSTTTVNVYGNTAYGNTMFTPGMPIMRRTKEKSAVVYMFKATDPEAQNAVDAAETLRRLEAS